VTHDLPTTDIERHWRHRCTPVFIYAMKHGHIISSPRLSRGQPGCMQESAAGPSLTAFCPQEQLVPAPCIDRQWSRGKILPFTVSHQTHAAAGSRRVTAT